MILKTNKTKPKNNPGFTIVELMIVIVIIGILAAIVIVAYIGISKKATEASIQSDLKGAKTQLELYKVEHGTYPTSVDENNCPLTPTPSTNYCLNKSIVYTSVGGDGLSYNLVITRNDVSYVTTENTPPFITVPITGISAITGIAKVSQTLTAGSITPAGANVTYQWQSSTSAGGSYANIAGATSSTYILTMNEATKYVRVVATGAVGYSGTKTSLESAKVALGGVDWPTIGTQTWAKANLNVGTMGSSLLPQTNNSIVEKYCIENLESNCTIYGALYQHDEAVQYADVSGAQGICPAGSHIPSDNDWKILEMHLGLTQAEADAFGYRGTNQGTQLMPGGSSGLNLELAGIKFGGGSFGGISWYNYLMSSGSSIIRTMGAGRTDIYRASGSQYDGYSVRCLAD